MPCVFEIPSLSGLWFFSGAVFLVALSPWIGSFPYWVLGVFLVWGHLEW